MISHVYKYNIADLVGNHFWRVKILTITLSAMLYWFYHTKNDENKKNVIQFEWAKTILAWRCVMLFHTYVTSSQQMIAIHDF